MLVSMSLSTSRGNAPPHLSLLLPPFSLLSCEWRFQPNAYPFPTRFVLATSLISLPLFVPPVPRWKQQMIVSSPTSPAVPHTSWRGRSRLAWKPPGSQSVIGPILGHCGEHCEPSATAGPPPTPSSAASRGRLKRGWFRMTLRCWDVRCIDTRPWSLRTEACIPDNAQCLVPCIQRRYIYGWRPA